MNTKILSLLEALQDISPPRDNTYIIHTSLFLASPVKTDLKETFEILREILGKNSTLCFPTFTFRNNSKVLASWNEIGTPGEVGVLNEYVRKNVHSIRTIHPTHSFVILGEDAREIVEKSGGSAFGEDSALYQIISRGGFNISFGAPFIGGHSFLHVAEELNQVPYRNNIVLKTPCELRDGSQSGKVFTYFARNLCHPGKYHENNWTIAWQEFTENGLVKFRNTSSGLVTLMKCGETLKFMAGKIKVEPYHYAENCPHGNI